MEYLTKRIESKEVLWFKRANKYLVFDPQFHQLFKKFNKESFENVEKYLISELELSRSEISDLHHSFLTIKKKLSFKTSPLEHKKKILIPKKWAYTFTYLVYGFYIKINYSSSYVKELMHPKFAHLQSKSVRKQKAVIDVIEQGENLFLRLDNKEVEFRNKTEAHFLQGKFALLLLNITHTKVDSNWMAVLHASAVFKNNKALVFLGESGSGKSTATTLLSLNGYKLLADDFVPVESGSNKAYSFPAAISIKEHMLAYLESFFPQLNKSELRYKNEAVNYKYLYLTKLQSKPKCLPIKALVFIKHKKGVEASFKQIKVLKALEYLIPDSWISSNEQNVKSFLDWIEKTPSYQLEYSNSEDLLEISQKIMDDDL